MHVSVILTTRGTPSATERALKDLSSLVVAGHHLCHIEGDPQTAAGHGWSTELNSPHVTKLLNNAIESHPADIYLWLHDDMRFYPDWFESLMDCMAQCSDVWAGSPRNWGNPQIPATPDVEFDDSYWLTSAPLLDLQAVERHTVENHRGYSIGSTMPIAIKHEAVEAVGLYDERLVGFCGYDDYDFSRRIFDAGKLCVTFDRSVVWHRGMGTRYNTGRNPTAHSLNKNIFKLKHGILLDRDCSPFPRPVEQYELTGWDRMAPDA